MRVTGTVSDVVLAAIVVAGCVMAWMRIHQLESELALQGVSFEQVARRAEMLEASTGALRQSARESRQAAMDGSNRLIQAQRQLAEERSTHEPLRQQIERMMQQDIVSRSMAERRDRSIKDTDAVIKTLRHDLEVAHQQATTDAQRISQLETEVRTRTESGTSLRRSLDEAGTKLSATQTERDQAVAKVRDLEQKLDELTRQAAASMKRTEAMASTNAPVKAGP